METGMVKREQASVTEFRRATDAAELCKTIVQQTAKKIQGRRYVCVEGWQSIATAHGCVLSCDEVREDEEGNVISVATCRRIEDQAVLARAEGFVGMDEKAWAGRPRYARRAMAQTRAMSRVARSAFAHVVVMIDAGLCTTPAEEVSSDGFVDVPHAEVPEKAQPHQSKAKFPVSEKQRKMLYARMKAKDMTEDQMRELVLTIAGVEHSTDIDRNDMDALLDAIEGWEPEQPKGADDDGIPY
jgi:hypothetical protein